MAKKIMSLLVVMIMTISLLCGVAFATEPTVATTLPEAVNGVITLTEDVVLTKTAVINTTVTLNLNGYTIKNEVDVWNKAVKDWSLISVREGGNLTITGEGSLLAKENDCYGIDVQNGGKLTINSGKIVGNISAVYANMGEVTINGGEYSIK